MPGIREQFSHKGPAISRAIPALAAIEAGIPALSPAFGGAYGPEQRGFGQSDSPASMYNPYRMRASMSGAQTITASAGTTPNWQIVQFNSVASPGYDTQGLFNTSTYQHKISLDGYYAIQGRVSATKSANADHYFVFGLAIFRNGTEYSRGLLDVTIADWVYGPPGGIQTEIFLSGSNADFSRIHADTLFFNKGDLVDIRVCKFLSSDSLTTDTTVNYFSVSLSFV